MSPHGVGRGFWAYFVVGAFVLLTLMPLYAMVSVALMPSAGLSANLYRLWPSTVSVGNFASVWHALPLLTYLRNSLVIASAATAVCLCAGVPAAYALSKGSLPGRRAMLLFLLATQMLPPTILAVASYHTLAVLHGTDTYWGLVVLDSGFYGLPFTTWVTAGYMRQIPPEVEEAAALDGCPRWRRVAEIVLPMSLPAIVVGAVFAFIAAWNDFVFALTLATSTGVMPLTVGIYDFISPYKAQWNYLMAAALVATVPIVVFFLVLQRRLVAGFTAGAVR